MVDVERAEASAIALATLASPLVFSKIAPSRRIRLQDPGPRPGRVEKKSRPTVHPFTRPYTNEACEVDIMEITPVQSEDEWQEARAIREQVFIDEQDCPPEEEWDGHDDTSRHVLGWVDGEPVATARWRTVPHEEEIVAKLERFAVLPAHRDEGHGTALVQSVLADARGAGFETFLVHAQAHLEDWYASLGFRATGRTFDEVGIPHVEMVRRAGA